MPGKVGYTPLDMADVNRVYTGGRNKPLTIFWGSLVTVVPCLSWGGGRSTAGRCSV